MMRRVVLVVWHSDIFVYMGWNEDLYILTLRINCDILAFGAWYSFGGRKRWFLSSSPTHISVIGDIVFSVGHITLAFQNISTHCRLVFRRYLCIAIECRIIIKVSLVMGAQYVRFQSDCIFPRNMRQFIGLLVLVNIHYVRQRSDNHRSRYVTVTNSCCT